MSQLTAQTTVADTGLNAALQLIMRIEARLTYGRAIYDKDGRRLECLEDVIQAILTDNLHEEI